MSTSMSLILNRLEKLYNDPKIHRNKMRVKGIGRIDLLPDAIRNILQKLDEATKEYDGHFLNIAPGIWRAERAGGRRKKDRAAGYRTAP